MAKISFDNIYEGEYMISKLVQKHTKCFASFNYNLLYPGGTKTTLQLISYNPVEKNYKILYQTDGVNMENSLEKMYIYLNTKLTQ